MRIGVLEWASSGGGAIGAARPDANSSTCSGGLPASIIEEGWAMTQAAIESLMAAGHAVSACLLPELATRIPASADNTFITVDVNRPIKRQWQSLYADCDTTIVIAPESDRVLEQLIAWCRRRSIATCNAQPEYIRRATDKLFCAVRWRECALPHPPTRSLAYVTEQWLSVAALQAQHLCAAEPMFVVKPRDGVGCDGIERLVQRDVLAAAARLQQQGVAARWLVQPWMEGVACSRAAIVRPSETRQWMPVTRQCLSVGATVAYHGSQLEYADWPLTPEFEKCLDAAIDSAGPRAAGWVGVDFVYHPTHHFITLIEVNPRLTTSFVELRRVVDPALAGRLLDRSTAPTRE